MLQDTRLIYTITYLYTNNEQVEFEIKTYTVYISTEENEILKYESRKICTRAI